MRKRILVLIAFLFLSALCSMGFAQDFTVTNAQQFQAALSSADSNGVDDTITLEAGTYVASPDTFTYSPETSNEGSLTIVGSGDVVLDGEDSGRILDINCEWMTDITLQEMIFQNGNTDEPGAGAYIHLGAGNIEVKECILKNNSATSSGGALHALIATNGSIRITNCHFTSNSALTLDRDDYYDHDYYPGGGALYAHVEDTGDISVQDNTFTGNSSSVDGGAAFVNLDIGDLNITGNNCTSNHASDEGGAFYLRQEWAGTTTLQDNTFQANTAETGGGAVYFNPEETNSFNCMGNYFESNVTSGDGGALYQMKEDSTFTYLFDNYFISNSAGNRGGAAFIRFDDDGQFTMVSNDYYRNNADSYGGGLYLYSYDSTSFFYVDKCSFRENLSSGQEDDYDNYSDAGPGGGGAYIDQDNGYCLVMESTFSDNTASCPGSGMYIHLEEGGLYVALNIFDKNIVSGDYHGGGAYIYCEDGDLEIENSSFTNNVAGNYGGGIYVNKDCGNLLFSNNVVAGNTSPYEGGGAYFYPEYVRYADIVNNTIIGNIVSEDGHSGGGISIECGSPNAIYSIYNNIIWNNTASDGNDLFLKDSDEEDHYINYFSVCNNNFSVLSHDFTASSDLYETANVNEDPMFVSSTDFHLQAGSSLIDLGDALAPSLPEIDRDGNGRIWGDNVDMGAYEYGSGTSDIDTSTTTTASGSGGCNTGAFVPSLLLLLAPLFFLAKKR